MMLSKMPFFRFVPNRLSTNRYDRAFIDSRNIIEEILSEEPFSIRRLTNNEVEVARNTKKVSSQVFGWHIGFVLILLFVVSAFITVNMDLYDIIGFSIFASCASVAYVVERMRRIEFFKTRIILTCSGQINILHKESIIFSATISRLEVVIGTCQDGSKTAGRVSQWRFRFDSNNHIIYYVLQNIHDGDDAYSNISSEFMNFIHSANIPVYSVYSATPMMISSGVADVGGV